MDLLYISLAITCVAASIYAWKFLNWAWLTPKKLEKSLRQQGFNGNPYKFLLGDLQELMAMEKESLSKPIAFSDDFIPRIMPFVHKTLTNYGTQSCQKRQAQPDRFWVGLGHMICWSERLLG